jgi:predicted transcriptional regulator
MQYKHFRMDTQTHAQLSRLAKAERRSMAEVVRQALRTYEAATAR